MAFDEEDSIGSVLRSTRDYLTERFDDWEVIVVDDGSRDKTGSIVEQYSNDDSRIRLLVHETNQGMGKAIQTGYLAARKDLVTQLPADGQVQATTLELFLGYFPDVDIVLSVYDRRGDGPVRTLLSNGYNLLGRILFNQRCDYTGTMVFKRRLIDEYQITSGTFLANLEFPLRILEGGHAHELVTFRPVARIAGASKVAKPGRILRVAKEMIKMRLRWNSGMTP